jgi:hypothetical protein
MHKPTSKSRGLKNTSMPPCHPEVPDHVNITPVSDPRCLQIRQPAQLEKAAITQEMLRRHELDRAVIISDPTCITSHTIFVVDSSARWQAVAPFLTDRGQFPLCAALILPALFTSLPRPQLISLPYLDHD